MSLILLLFSQTSTLMDHSLTLHVLNMVCQLVPPGGLIDVCKKTTCWSKNSQLLNNKAQESQRLWDCR
eukprot:2158078-Karenia_brevis.AAC.1